MNGFEYLKVANQLYVPRTPRAALLAVEHGLLPDVAYIYKASSVKPLFEEPVDIPEIERALAGADNDLSTNLLLMSIFERLLGNRDAEIALFAAESINTIENRYNAKIESYKENLDGDDPTEALRGIATQFYELACINADRPAIKRFYLAEAYSYLKKLYRRSRFTKNDLELTVRVLLALKLPDRASFILNRIKGAMKDNPDVLLLRAEVEFSAKRFDRVAEIIERIRTTAPWVRSEQQVIVKLWTEAAHA